MYIYLFSKKIKKKRFRIHKSDINTCKVRCCVGNHVLNFCHSPPSKFECLPVQLMQKVSVQNDDNIDKALWERKKYWQTQLFTLSLRLNNPNECCALNIRGYMK